MRRINRDFLEFFFLCTLFNSASSLPPLRFHAVSEEAGIEPRTVSTLALTARCFTHSARSHPQSAVVECVEEERRGLKRENNQKEGGGRNKKDIKR
jgi:hypothetical protein